MNNMLKNKIDFVVVLSVKNANPNGDPLNGNRPREDYQGYGEISDVCLKRKIRNRLQDLGNPIFVQSNDRSDDGFQSLNERAGSITSKGSQEDYAKEACETWIDVRSFGQVFAFKGSSGKKGEGISVAVRGPVSLHSAISVTPVDITSLQITKSVNSEPTEKGKKSSDTMGMKHRVDFGVYTFAGSINCQLAEKTGFSDEDAEQIHEAIKTLFENDASSARPDGSMIIERVYWWKHDSKNGQYPSAKVHKSVRVRPKDGVVVPRSFEDIEIQAEDLEGLTPEVYSL